MKKLFTLFIALAATICLWAYDFQSGNLYYKITSSTAPYIVEVASGDYSGLTTATIPSTVTHNGTTYSVTSIGWRAFYGCSSLTSVTIPNSVTSIGDEAFDGCTSLTSITIPNSVTSIGEYAFYGTGIYENESNWENDILYIDNCLINAKTSISGTYAIKENTRLIADYAFISSLYLTSITIPSSVTSIGESAFGNCSRLSSITIPNSVTSMGDYVFARCDSLAFVSIGDGVKSIGEYAFSECYSLKNVYIGNSVTSIGNRAFYFCRELSSITIPNSVTSIGEYAFFNCFSLASVDLGNGVISIGTHAFNYCSTLSYITIPNSVKSIGSWAFSECSSLKYASIGSGVSSVPEYAFYNCYKLFYLTISNSVTSIGKQAFFTCCSLTDITIPNSVTSIGDEAFIWCEALNSVSIGNSITSIGSSAFAWCKSIKSIACFAMTPPVLGNDVFKKCDNATLFVLCEALPNYQAHEQFEQFANIECIGSEKVETEDVVIESGTNDVTITWPVEMEADTYTIVIKSINEICCTLNFNADGQLLNIAFAPSRDGNHRHAQYAEQIANGGFRFTLTGLEEGTNYTYDIIVKDQQDKELSTYSGEFTTKSNVTTDMDNIQSPASTCQKVMRNGQLIILRDGKTYTTMGAEIE